MAAFGKKMKKAAKPSRNGSDKWLHSAKKNETGRKDLKGNKIGSKASLQGNTEGLNGSIR
jgi:hypothetical protein